MDKTCNLHHVLTELMREHNLAPKMFELQILALWRKCVRKHGVPLSTQTAPVSLSNGILKIYTEFPPYRTALTFHKQEIIADINAELGQPILTDFRIEIRPARAAASHEIEDQSSSPEMPEEDSTIGNTYQVTPEQLEKIEQALASVSDTHLRESLWQLFTTQSEDSP